MPAVTERGVRVGQGARQRPPWCAGIRRQGGTCGGDRGVLKRGHGGCIGASDEETPPPVGSGAAAPSTPGCSNTRGPPAASWCWRSPSEGITALLLIAAGVADRPRRRRCVPRPSERWTSLRALLALLAVVAGPRFLAWAAERTAHRVSASAKSELRRAPPNSVPRLGPAGLERNDTGRLSTLLTTASTRSTAISPVTCPNCSWP